MKKHNDSEWDLSISKEEWEEIMAEEAERQMIEDALAAEAMMIDVLEEERELEEECRRHAGISTRINDIDWEPEDPEDVSPDYGYASYFA